MCSVEARRRSQMTGFEHRRPMTHVQRHGQTSFARSALLFRLVWGQDGFHWGQPTSGPDRRGTAPPIVLEGSTGRPFSPATARSLRPTNGPS